MGSNSKRRGASAFRVGDRNGRADRASSRNRSTERRGAGYQVGRGKPPREYCFPPGHFGNPRGRPKGVRDFRTDVKRTLGAPVKVTTGGRARKVSTQEGALLMLREKALRGDPRARDRLLELGVRFNNDTVEIGPAQPLLADDDEAILRDYEAEILARAKPVALLTDQRANAGDAGPGTGDAK